MKTLVIVESPAKAGTITKILGAGYEVTSSFGHVRDLAKDGEKNTGVDIADKYKPHYIITPDKKKVVDDLKRKLKKHDMVLLATDEDREGEAISWHLYEVLGLTKKNSKRITFTEITPSAIKEAVAHPRDINLDLVDAQQARRVLDRLVGFELTGLLWKKIRAQLSAGRVQSVAVRLLVDREREIKSFSGSSYFRVTGTFDAGKKISLPAEVIHKFTSEKDAQSFLEQCEKAIFTVDAMEKKPAKKKPSAPFTTSTLQQLASQKLGFSVSRTMSAAQKLYEAGHITYMRTDSITLSGTALASIAGFVTQEFGTKYSTVRNFKTKAKNSQEAHEAIRPTYINKHHVTDNPDQQKLYTLIRTRTLASQMSDAEVERTQITITSSTSKKYVFIAKGEVVLFDGFLRAYSGTKYYAQDDVLLPDVTQGQTVNRIEIQALERELKPPSRYSEATLVKKLEELGIGRPSTYAPTIAKITSPNRGYITKETRDGEPREFKLIKLNSKGILHDHITEVVGAQKNKLFASDMGILVTDFLCEHFKDIMDYRFTAEVENKLDDIAQGKAEWQKVIDLYYKPFAKTVGSTLKQADRVSGEKVLGKDPSTGRTVLVRISKYGPVVQIGSPDELKEDEKPAYANLMPSQSIESISLDDALKLFGIPRIVGQYKNKDIIINRGRFGPYAKYDEQFISLGRDVNPFTITLEEALVKVKQKLEELRPLAEYEGAPITRGKGRFGPYIKWNDTFVAITKSSGVQFDSISEDQAIELVKAKIKKDKEKLLHSWNDGVITLEKGRWGAIIRVKGKRGFMAVPKGPTGEKLTQEALEKMTFDEMKKLLKLTLKK